MNNNKNSKTSKVKSQQRGLNYAISTKRKRMFSIHQGAQVLALPRFGLLTSQKNTPRANSPKVTNVGIVGLLTIFGLLAISASTLLFSNSAYAAFYVDVSSTSAVKLTETGSADGGSIKPSGSGTLGTGSDVVTVNTNCTAGYNLYVSATSTGSTNLNLSGASSSELQDAANYIVPSSNTPSAEGTLTKDTWGVGKTSSTFAGLQAYSADAGTWTPLYTTTSTDISNGMAESLTPGVATLTHNVYYGVNISTAKTPGTYTGNVLYTVLMGNACTEYTLKFDDGIDDSDTEAQATITSNLPNGIPTTEEGGKGAYPKYEFGESVDLAQYSTTAMIKRTGYTLSGWKIKVGDGTPSGTVYPTNTNTVLDDSETSDVTLIAVWEPNTYTIHYNANPPSGKTASGSTADQTGQAYDSTTTLRANGFTITGYHVTGWAYTVNGTKAFDSGQANVSIKTLAENAKPNSVVDENNATINLYALWAANTYYINYDSNGGSGSTTRTTATYDQNVNLASSTFTAPSGKKFKEWNTDSDGGGTTYTQGQTLTTPNFTAVDGGEYTLYAIWEDDGPIYAGNCSDTVHPTATQSCRMADGRTWTYGNSGNTLQWASISGKCPSGYNLPSRSVYINLIDNYSGGGLYNALHLSGGRFFWSFTEYDSNNAYVLRVSSSDASTNYSVSKTNNNIYLLCYK